jgi:serine/arginine repetitive matrix protein 1
MAGNFFRGTTVEQDGRWGKSDEKMIKMLTKAGKFSEILNTKVELNKINLDIISKWISQKLLDLLGFEDEVVTGLVINMLQTGQV